MKKSKLLFSVLMMFLFTSCTYQESKSISRYIIFKDPNETVVIRVRISSHTLPYLLSGESGEKIDKFSIFPASMMLNKSKDNIKEYPEIKCKDIDFCMREQFSYFNCGPVIIPDQHIELFDIEYRKSFDKSKCRIGQSNIQFKSGW